MRTNKGKAGSCSTSRCVGTRHDTAQKLLTRSTIGNENYSQAEQRRSRDYHCQIQNSKYVRARANILLLR